MSQQTHSVNGPGVGSGRQYRFATRMAKTPKSFIREILKVTENPQIISFAGGLPSPDLIDVDGIARATASVLKRDGRTALQYATTEGYLPLRQYIAERYKKRLGLSISPDEILITNGSQQCLDLIGKVLINTGDHVAIERPGYLGAIQAFSLYEPHFHPVLLDEDGPDMAQFAHVLDKNPIRLFYGVPNSQNPSGVTYSKERRREIGKLMSGQDALFIEDDAYGELTFDGTALPSIRQFLPEQTIITGSFSKILAPGMRLGWAVAPPQIMDQLIIAKQASDLHSNYLSQRIAHEYLLNEDIDKRIAEIRETYKQHCGLMVSLIRELMPESVTCTHPRGGMFVWMTLPEKISSMEVFDKAIRNCVAVLPGTPFYVDGGGNNTLRVNFSNATPEKIQVGIERLSRVILDLDRN
jgi:2-aminoadipate transaminase